jgi:hypothetical protein
MTLWVIDVAFKRVLKMLLRILTQARVDRCRWRWRRTPRWPDSRLFGPPSAHIGPAPRFTVEIDPGDEVLIESTDQAD